MSKRPNIIFMIADDHRHRDIHALHNSPVQTPNFDKLIEEGTSFTNTHIMGGWHRAVCAPSRACVLTGGNVFNAVLHEPEPVFDNNFNSYCNINQQMELMPEVLKKAGYYTHAVGKWHNDKQSFNKSFKGGDALFFKGMSDPENIPLHQYERNGEYLPEEAEVSKKHATERFCDAGVQFIEEYNKEEPFFMYMAFTSPHDPRIAPQKYRDLYNPADIPLPKNFMPVHPFDNGEMHVRDEELAKLPREPQEVSQHIASYYSMISHMDAEIGRVLDALQKKGIADNTIVVYTSDHGLSLGQHGLIGKQNLYDASIRIPFIIKGPGLRREQTIDALACQMDIFPTLCELTDIQVPETVDGKSLVPLIKEQKKKAYGSVFSAYKDLQRMVKKDQWKLIRYYRSDTSHTGSEKVQLFNIEEDPWETNNLIENPEYLYLFEELSQELKQWQVKVRDPLIA
jgi:arylsulfatase A-like enzyme